MILKNKLLTRDQILSLLEIVSLAWPIAAIFMGIKIATNFAISPSAFTWNTVAASIGILLNFGLRSDYINRTSFEKTFPWLGIGTLIVVGVTLISPGLEGVHRYISIGKFISNPSAQLSPVALFLVYYFIPRNLYFAISLAMVLSGIHFFQPDAGQATSFGFSVVFLFAFARKLPRAGRTIGCFFPLALALATWLRPDPLPSLPHVEGILHLSLQLDWPWIALTFFLLIGLFIPFGTPSNKIFILSFNKDHVLGKIGRAHV